MKKNYSNPKFKLVLLEPNDIVCDSLTDGGTQNNVELNAKQRNNNIWGEDDE